jgi:hypothetical protein
MLHMNVAEPHVAWPAVDLDEPRHLPVPWSAVVSFDDSQLPTPGPSASQYDAFGAWRRGADAPSSGEESPRVRVRSVSASGRMFRQKSAAKLLSGAQATANQLSPKELLRRRGTSVSSMVAPRGKGKKASDGIEGSPSAAAGAPSVL